MADGLSGSTVPRRQLGRELRQLRDRAGMTIAAAADALEWSTPKIWRIEKGRTSLRSHDVRSICELYGAAADTTEGLMALARETKSRGWWHSYGDVIPEWFEVYVGLEAASSHISLYESELLPGLLQTEEYARALGAADGGINQDETDRRVKVRLGRQALLTRESPPAPQLDVYLSEAAIRRQIGGPAVMAAQLDHLLSASALPNVCVRVVPFEVGATGGTISGPFTLLDFPTNGDGTKREPETVYVQQLTGALYLDKAHEISRYRTMLADLAMRSLDESASRESISTARREFPV